MTDDIELRPATDDDVDEVTAIGRRQDVEWWATPDTDEEGTRLDFERACMATGSLDAGTRVADRRGTVIGFAALVGHGDGVLTVDPASPDAGAAMHRLVGWLRGSGVTSIDSPAQDAVRLGALAGAGFHPERSSFELERSAELDDLEPAVWPAGIALTPFELGVDDQAVHDLIYSIWTDVQGHTFRPIDEWRTLMLGGSSFDPEHVIVARRLDDDRRVAGVALCRVFHGDIGWVHQLAVGRPDRGIGLGRALLVESLHRLAAADVKLLGLGVEAQNVGALGLYESVGLSVAREWIHCSPE